LKPDQNSDLTRDTPQAERIDQLVIHVKTRRATHIVVCGLAAAKLDRRRGTVAIMEGTSVISSDGKPVGSIERVLAKPDANGPKDYLIAQSLLLKEKQLIPVEWIDSFENAQVRLAPGARARLTTRS